MIQKKILGYKVLLYQKNGVGVVQVLFYITIRYIAGGITLGHTSGTNGSLHTPNFEDFFSAVVREIDVYDFKTKTWSILPSDSSLPQGSAAGGVGFLDGKILYFGGETGTLNLCWEFDIITQVLSEVPSLNQGRHGSQAISYDNKIWIACGCPVRAGSLMKGHPSNITSLEVYSV